MKRFLLWLVRPCLRWVASGKPVALIETNGSSYMEGRIIGIRVSPDAAPEIDVVPLGGSIHDCRTLKLYGGLRWNNAAKRFELERDNAVESRRRRPSDRDVESRDDHPGDRTSDRKAPEHGESPAEEPRPAPATDGGPHGESEGGVRPGHDADIPSEGHARGSDSPRKDTNPGSPGHQGALIRLGENKAIPPGTLIGVTPDQHLHICHVTEYGGNLPDGSIIWGHPHTIGWIRGGVPNQAMH